MSQGFSRRVVSLKLEKRSVLSLSLAGLLTAALIVAGLVQAPMSAAAPAASAFDPCAFPTAPASMPEQTAWQIFVAATCPTTDSSLPLTFEKWTEQTCLIDPKQCAAEQVAEQHHLHASHLALGLAPAGGLPSNECSPMTGAWTNPAPSSLVQFVPKNLAADATFCEEVFANPAEIAYINAPAPGQSLRTLSQQAAYVASGRTIDFPTAAVEIKVDWLPRNALNPPAFDCDSPPSGLYTEVIDGTCYAMVGIHFSSKLFQKWLWATFEPQLEATNPNLCNPDLYSSCSDPWGSNPATSTTNKPTQQTANLAGLMNAAKLAPAFRNYRLVGVQTDFVNSQSTLLGNTFVEFNAGVPAQQASCITCHNAAQFNTTWAPVGKPLPYQNPNFAAFPGTPPVGTPSTVQPPVPPGTWQHQDFSWLLGVLPEKPAGQ